MTLIAILESILFPPRPALGNGLPDPPVRKAAKEKAPESGIKYTAGGLPYVEAKPEGQEASAWNVINAENAGAATRSKLGTEEEIQAGREKGFSPETVALVRLHWADGKKQAAIAKATGLSLDTVKKITPIFSKGGRG